MAEMWRHVYLRSRKHNLFGVCCSPPGTSDETNASQTDWYTGWRF